MKNLFLKDEIKILTSLRDLKVIDVDTLLKVADCCDKVSKRIRSHVNFIGLKDPKKAAEYILDCFEPETISDFCDEVELETEIEVDDLLENHDFFSLICEKLDVIYEDIDIEDEDDAQFIAELEKAINTVKEHYKGKQ